MIGVRTPPVSAGFAGARGGFAGAITAGAVSVGVDGEGGGGGGGAGDGVVAAVVAGVGLTDGSMVLPRPCE